MVRFCISYYDITPPIFTGRCPAGYNNHFGDVSGWGSIRGLASVKNIESCAKHCDITSGCCSFEYSQSEQSCNLNSECAPTSTEVYKDFSFCGKDQGDTQTQIRTPTRTETRTCRCNGHFNARGDGECGTKFNGGHFCYVNPGDCSDGVRSANTGLWWSYQACNGANNQQPRSREPKAIDIKFEVGRPELQFNTPSSSLQAIGFSSSLVQEIAGGTCVTSCDNWPHSQCKVEFRFGNGGRQSATCIAPYNGFVFNNQPQKFSNYPK